MMILGDSEMKPLAVPLPPNWEIVVGWTGGDARWLAVAWEGGGDHPWLEDGRLSMSGRSLGYLGWARHTAVAPHLTACDIGGSDHDGSQRLLVDRIGRAVYVADLTEARWMVRGQWPAEEPSKLRPEEVDAVVEQVRQAWLTSPPPSTEEVIRRMREHSRQVATMISWLDEWVAKKGGN